mgnify:CR=1 FL=1
MNNSTARRTSRFILATLAVTMFAGAAYGQAIDGIADVDKAAKLAAKQQDGWKNKLDLGATGAASSSSKVVGAAEGATYQIGLVLQGEAKLKAGQHAWNNELKLQHAQTRTPVIDQFVKSADVLDASSTWLYALESIDWIGPYARLKLNTQVLEGYDVRSGAVNVAKTEVDGTVTNSITEDGDVTDVTGFFEPLILTEGAGLFANPWDDKAFTLQAKLGGAVQQIIVQDGYAVSGYDADQNLLSLKQLETSNQAGAEFELAAKGEMTSEVSWKAKATFFFPVISTATNDFDGLDALNSDLSGSVSVKLAKWASLDYVLSIKRIPLVLDEWQVQHGLLLSTAFSLL